MSITALNDYAIGDIDLTAIVETLDKTYKGKAEITLSEYDTDSAPDVKVGSVFENNGALFIVDTSDITPTGYSGISVSTTFYLYFDSSATAFIYSSTVPTWSDALQGWYNGNDRAFFSMYKDSGGTLYEGKYKLIEGNKSVPIPDYGDIGTIVIATSNAWLSSTIYLPGTTVSGSTLYGADHTAGTIESLNCDGVTSMIIENTDWVSLGFVGIWRLLTRVGLSASATSKPVGMFQRIS